MAPVLYAVGDASTRPSESPTEQSCYSLVCTTTSFIRRFAEHFPSLHIIIKPRHFQTKSYKNYIVSNSTRSFTSETDVSQVVDAAVVPLSQIQESYPELITKVNPTDFTRLRYVVTLQNAEGELRRVRLLQWNVRSLAWWNKLPKDSSAELAEGAAQALMYSVEHNAPDIVEKQLGLGR